MKKILTAIGVLVLSITMKINTIAQVPNISISFSKIDTVTYSNPQGFVYPIIFVSNTDTSIASIIEDPSYTIVGNGEMDFMHTSGKVYHAVDSPQILNGTSQSWSATLKDSVKIDFGGVITKHNIALSAKIPLSVTCPRSYGLSYIPVHINCTIENNATQDGRQVDTTVFMPLYYSFDKKSVAQSGQDQFTIHMGDWAGKPANIVVNYIGGNDIIPFMGNDTTISLTPYTLIDSCVYVSIQDTSTYWCQSPTLEKICVLQSPLGIQNTALNQSVSIYPNPVSNILRFSKETSYRIYDQTGRLVLSSDKQALSVELHLLSPGLYYVITPTIKKTFIKI